MIVVEHVAGLATIQDLGRPGRMHEGLAPGGALVPAMLVAANRAAGNADHAPVLEVFGRIRLRAVDPVLVAATTNQKLAAGQEVAAVIDQPMELAAGQELVVESGNLRV
nr:hypothetical protein [Deltaproteobacteria bacterium]